jgi:hypothetical protein
VSQLEAVLLSVRIAGYLTALSDFGRLSMFPKPSPKIEKLDLFCDAYFENDRFVGYGVPTLAFP